MIPILLVVVMVVAVDGALGIRHFNSVLTDHLSIVVLQTVVLIVILVEFNHGEFLLQRACPVLLS